MVQKSLFNFTIWRRCGGAEGPSTPPQWGLGRLCPPKPHPRPKRGVSMADDLLNITSGDLLDRQAERFGERDALVHVEHGVRYTYAEFRAECDRVAKGMIALGIEKGDHVGIWATNYPEWVVAQFATSKIAAVLVTVNPSYRTHELEYLLKQSDTSTLLLIGSFKTSDYVAMINELIPELRDAEPGQ